MLKEMMTDVVNEVTGRSPDAITLLEQDHRAVEALFKAFENSDDRREKRRLARQICEELDTHARIEEQVFYPAAERVAQARDLIHEGEVEHEGIKRLVREIPQLSASDDYFEPRVKVLMEYVKHHVKEEETQTFPRLRKSDLDLQALGEQLAQRKARLKKQSRAPRRASSSRRPNGAMVRRRGAAASSPAARAH